MTLVGTRPELIKMSRVIPELDNSFKHIFVHSGQNYDYELNQIFFEDLEIRKPDYFLEINKSSTAETIGDIIKKTDLIFIKEKPDALLIYGDTNTSLAVIAAKKRQIPIFHMEAGNRSFDQRVPEESNRKIVDHLSDINMVLTENARRYLIDENISPDRIFKTGSHLYEIIKYYEKKIDKSSIKEKLKIKKSEYFVVSAHREENVDNKKNLKDLIDSLNHLAKEYKFPIIVSVHPRTKKRVNAIGKIKINKLIKFIKPLNFTDYINLQKHAFCILSDSGTITEEASILNLPAITIRNSHERPEGMDAGTLIMSGLKYTRIIESIRIIRAQYDAKINSTIKVFDYENDFVSRQIIRIVISYLDYINKRLWMKN